MGPIIPKVTNASESGGIRPIVPQQTTPEQGSADEIMALLRAQRAAPNTFQSAEAAPNTFQSAGAAPRPQGMLGSGDARLNSLVDRAVAIDPVLGSNIRLRNRISNFLESAKSEWMRWGEKSISAVSAAAADLAKITLNLKTADATKWADETRVAFQKGSQNGITTWFTGGGKKPDYYRTRLTNARTMLDMVLADARRLLDDLRPRIETIQLDDLVLKVCTESITDANDLQVATGRQRTLLTSLQTALGIITSVEQMVMTTTKVGLDIDQLLTGIIPMWIAQEANA